MKTQNETTVLCPRCQASFEAEELHQLQLLVDVEGCPECKALVNDDEWDQD